jgi:hypothetical protein
MKKFIVILLAGAVFTGCATLTTGVVRATGATGGASARDTGGYISGGVRDRDYFSYSLDDPALRK